MANLISQYTNGTFEGVLASWGAIFSAASTAQIRDGAEFHEGLFSAKLTTAFLNGPSLSDGLAPFITVNFPGEPFKPYRVSCWVKVSNDFADDNVLFLNAVNLDSSHQNKGYCIPVRASRAKMGWVELVSYFYGTPSGGQLTFQVSTLINSDRFRLAEASYPGDKKEFYSMLMDYEATTNQPAGAFIWIDEATSESVQEIPDMPNKQFTGRKLYYVRNVFLLTDESTVYEIEEPIKWGDIDISIKWDETMLGYKFEFTDGDVLLEFDEAAGRSIIRNAYKNRFERMNLSLKFGELDSANVLTILFESQLNFDSYKEGKYTVKMNCERKSFADKLRTRYDTPVDILGVNSVENFVLEPIPIRQLFLHPRILTHEANYIFNQQIGTVLEFPTLGAFPAVGKSGRVYLATDTQKYYRWSGIAYVEISSSITLTSELAPPGPDEWKTTVPPFQATSNNVEGLNDPVAPAGELIYSGFSLPPGVQERILFIDVRGVSFQFKMGNTTANVKAGISIYKRSLITQSTGSDEQPPFNDGVTDVSLVSSQDYGNVNGVKTFVDGGVNGILRLVEDEAIFIKIFVYTSNNAAFSITDFRFTNTSAYSLFVNEQTISAASVVNCIRLHEAINRQLELILDVANPLKSTMLGATDLGYPSNGCLSSHVVLDGLMVRNILNKAFNMTANEWFSSLSGLVCMGLSIERDNFGGEFVRFEPLEYFFRNVRIMRFDVISNYEKSPALRYIYNEAEFGFRKYPQNNQQDSIEDWMTKFSYILPIKSIKYKLSKIIDWILSPYYIQYARVQRFLDNPTNAYETDDDTFLISATDGTVSLARTMDFDQAGGIITVNDILPVIENDTFTISNATGSVSNGLYTVLAIEIPYTYDKTILTIKETLASDGGGTGDITLSLARMKAKRNEDFQTTSGIKSPESVYNLEHHIKRIMIRWAKVFNAGITKLFGDEYVAFVDGKNNIQAQTKLKDSVTCRFGSVAGGEPYGDRFGERAPDTLQLPLFGGNNIYFEAPLTWGTLNAIRLAFEGRDPNGANYGYFEWFNLDGELEKGYILDLKFNPVTQMIKANFIEKYG